MWEQDVICTWASWNCGVSSALAEVSFYLKPAWLDDSGLVSDCREVVIASRWQYKLVILVESSGGGRVAWTDQNA